MLMQEDAIDKLNQLLERIDDLELKSPCSPEFNEWHAQTESLIDYIFDEETQYLLDFRAIYFSPLFLSCSTDDAAFFDAYRGGLEEARNLLIFLIGELE